MFFGKNNNAPPSSDLTTPLAGKTNSMIIDVDTESFESVVINGSMDVPVLADFWAPWCGPCKQLGPMLEKLVQSYGGKVKLAKINLDENQQLAAALRVQSVPTVYAFFGGRPIDAFQGLLPESQIKAFLDKVLETVRQAQPDALDIPETLKAGAAALAEGDLNGAQSIFMMILQVDDKNAAAFNGLVRVLIAAGQIEQAQSLVENASEDIQKSPLFNESRTALDVVLNIPTGEETVLLEKLKTQPDDHQTRLDLAMIEFANSKKANAIENLLYIIENDRAWNDQAARQQLLKFFEAMGHSDPLTVASRKRLSTILFS